MKRAWPSVGLGILFGKTGFGIVYVVMLAAPSDACKVHATSGNYHACNMHARASASFGTRAQVLKNDDFERLEPAALLYMARGDAAQ